ncbi:MAG: endolytic transglycosylase MltG [Alphaproteobacteria bacterium]|nr:endolytic transglycosylase MltG [Alphaproteobacteria bacterium]
MKKILILFLSLCVIASAFLYKWATENGPSEVESSIVVTRGSSVKSVAREMKAARIIDKPWLFVLSARLKKIDRRLRAGEYIFPKKVSLLGALEKIAKGDVYYRKVTLPNGLTVQQMFEIINDNDYLTGEITVSAKEGSMLPETYSFIRGDSRNSVVIQAKKSMKKVLDEAWEYNLNPALKAKKDVLVLASIIEKETSIAEERTIVSSVFSNRLRKKMRLQADPTIIYALSDFYGSLGRKLKKEDMKTDSPYNTYLYGGLPPTPICNPGRAAIEAAVNPEETKFLYFVADGEGGHSFSETYDTHRKNIKNWVGKIRSK